MPADFSRGISLVVIIIFANIKTIRDMTMSHRRPIIRFTLSTQFCNRTTFYENVSHFQEVRVDEAGGGGGGPLEAGGPQRSAASPAGNNQRSRSMSPSGYPRKCPILSLKSLILYSL